MTVSYVERDQADADTLAFYDKAEARFDEYLDLDDSGFLEAPVAD